MLGYRIYYNGENFAMDESMTQVQDTPGDSTTRWNAFPVTAYEAVKKLNSECKQDITELKGNKDFMVRTCKECGEYFIATKMFIDWFISRDLAIPCRCNTCREKRKLSKCSS